MGLQSNDASRSRKMSRSRAPRQYAALPLVLTHEPSVNGQTAALGEVADRLAGCSKLASCAGFEALPLASVLRPPSVRRPGREWSTTLVTSIFLARAGPYQSGFCGLSAPATQRGPSGGRAPLMSQRGVLVLYRDVSTICVGPGRALPRMSRSRPAFMNVALQPTPGCCVDLTGRRGAR
jgi:hypothetical protein